MLKIIFKSLFRRKKHTSNADTIKLELIKMSQKAREIAEDFDKKINGVKEALVHLVGEYCNNMIELSGYYSKFDVIESELDAAIRAENNDLARLKMTQKLTIERSIEACTESIEILIPKIKDLYHKKITLSAAQSDALHKAGLMEARARSSEAIGRANSIIGDSSLDIGEFGVESLNRSVDKLEAYEKAILEVGDGEKHSEKIEMLDEIDRLLADRKSQLDAGDK